MRRALQITRASSSAVAIGFLATPRVQWAADLSTRCESETCLTSTSTIGTLGSPGGKHAPERGRSAVEDNIYFCGTDGQWEQALAFFHTRPADQEKDTRYPCVFISDHFFYFGESAPAIPSQCLVSLPSRLARSPSVGQAKSLIYKEVRFDPGNRPRSFTMLSKLWPRGVDPRERAGRPLRRPF